MDLNTAKELIDEQFRPAKGLPIREVVSAGSENFIFRLGNDWTVRFPKNEAAALQLKKELAWLPVIAARMTVPVPIPYFTGAPNSKFPFQWAVFNWIDGRIYEPELLQRTDGAVAVMADFICSLWKIDAENGPGPGRQNNFRGQALIERDIETKSAINHLPSGYNKKTLGLIWEKASREKTWDQPPVWIHGDLHWGNIITLNDKINGIIDFGTLGVGDPAVDIMCAWILFSGEKRALFKQKLNVDDPTWIRAMGWALSFAVIALPYYLPKKHLLADIAVFTLENIMIDFAKYPVFN
ncbi:aminoglycoside phosphotransferase family protein [Niabella beijingensis]|uniref:aminoglycoside phosphotransferase family protein n=1 Tax=Niabella beijingensis TaxID=2872700 RepID=UPI0023E3D2D1|nr:aminoglycoside phosphotransferase family protein [Niabella beijingensis]